METKVIYVVKVNGKEVYRSHNYNAAKQRYKQEIKANGKFVKICYEWVREKANRRVAKAQ